MFAETTVAWVPFDMDGRKVSPKQVVQTAFFDCPSEDCHRIYFSQRYATGNTISNDIPYLKPVPYMGELTKNEIFERSFICRGILSRSDEGAVTRVRGKRTKK